MIKFFSNNFLNWKNIAFISVLSLIFVSVIFFIVPITYLAYGLFSLIEILSLSFIMIQNNFLLNNSEKYLNIPKKTFFINYFLFAVLFSLISLFISFFILAIFNIILPNQSATVIFVNNSILLDDESVRQLNWLEIGWLDLLYGYIVNLLLIIPIFIIFMKLRKNILFFLFLIFIVIYLFYSANFINFHLNFDSLSEWGTKSYHNLNVRFFQKINPFYWNNMFLSTTFITTGIFSNFNEFVVNKNDSLSMYQFIIPWSYIFVLNSFAFTWIYLKTH